MLCMGLTCLQDCLNNHHIIKLVEPGTEEIWHGDPTFLGILNTSQCLYVLNTSASHVSSLTWQPDHPLSVMTSLTISACIG